VTMGAGEAVRYLNQSSFNQAEHDNYESLRESPIRILQIGEGNFLRGFFDWMIQTCRSQGLYDGSIVVTQPRPSGKAHIEQLKLQDRSYTLMTRGIDQGQIVNRVEKISVFAKALDPYSDWAGFLALAENPDLQVVVSNTTEAGLTYNFVGFHEGLPFESYPAKLTAFLFRRFEHFNGDPAKGLILLPCELLERNGDELKCCLLQHSADWGLPPTFVAWLQKHNRFLNSLVDRIVPGFPQAEADQLFADWGYEDKLLTAAEPYHLWAIEAEPQLEHKLPLQKAGLNVFWVGDLRPFQIRKVRILNGAHTLMAPISLLYGLNEVREVMEHPRFGAFVHGAIDHAIIPSLTLDQTEARSYASSVFDRFNNPYIHHRLLDIAMNSISKFKVRLLPSMEAFLEQYGKLPDPIVYAFAGLMRFYKVRQNGEQYEGRRLNGEIYIVRDDLVGLAFFAKQWSELSASQINISQLVSRVLGSSLLWGKDLSGIEGLPQALTRYLDEMEEEQ
jgi:tagaturonate reductase